MDFVQHVSTEKELRDASSEASQKLGDFGVECEMRQDVYRALCEFKSSADLSVFSPIDQRRKESPV